MKRIVSILVLICIALSLGAITAGFCIDGSLASFSSKDLTYDIRSLGGGIVVSQYEDSLGLGVSAKIGAAYAPRAQLNGSTASGYGFWGPTCYHYNAQLGLTWKMPFDYGIFAGVHIAYNDVVFQKGGRLTEWERLSIHSIGWGGEFGVFFKAGKVGVSLSCGMEKNLSSWAVSRTRQDWETSAPSVSQLSNGSLSLKRISIAFSASR